MALSLGAVAFAGLVVWVLEGGRGGWGDWRHGGQGHEIGKSRVSVGIVGEFFLLFISRTLYLRSVKA